MSIDSDCPTPVDDLKIPTLRRGEEINACDRTDYGSAENLSFLLGSNGSLRQEAAKILAQGDKDATSKSAAQDVAKQAYDLNQYRLASPAVVRVNYQDGDVRRPRGSAFGVGTNGGECLYITDFHVASDESSPTAKLTGLTLSSNGQGAVEARVRNLDAVHDLALLSAPATKIGQCPSLPISSEKASALSANSDRIVTLGHPKGTDKIFMSAGVVSRTGRTHAEINDSEKSNYWAQSKTIEANLQVIGGMSGGPGLADGVVVGVTQSRVGATKAVLTPAEFVQSFIARSLNSGDSGSWCEYDKAKKEVETLRSQGKVTAVSFDGSHGEILKHYTLSTGERIDIDDSRQICERRKSP